MTWGFGSPREYNISDDNRFLNVTKEVAERKTLKLLNSIATSFEMYETCHF